MIVISCGGCMQSLRMFQWFTVFVFLFFVVVVVCFVFVVVVFFFFKQKTAYEI